MHFEQLTLTHFNEKTKIETFQDDLSKINDKNKAVIPTHLFTSD
jgi:hypothetical protein